MRNTFLEKKTAQNVIEKLVPDPFLKKHMEHIFRSTV